MKSVNTHSEESIDGNVLELDQRDFLGYIEGLRMTASSRINSNTDLSRIDETRDNITVEEGDLLVNEKNIHRQTHAHHKRCSCNDASLKFESKCIHVRFVPF